MRAATEGSLLPVMPQGNLVEVLGREVRQGSPGELMVESTPSRQRRPPCKTNKEMSDEAADAAALTYLLLTQCTIQRQNPCSNILKYHTHFVHSNWHLDVSYAFADCSVRSRVCALAVLLLLETIRGEAGDGDEDRRIDGDQTGNTVMVAGEEREAPGEPPRNGRGPEGNDNHPHGDNKEAPCGKLPLKIMSLPACGIPHRKLSPGGQ